MRALVLSLALGLVSACGPLGVDEPVRLTAPEPLRAIDIALSGQHSCAVTEAGRVLCWGDGSAGQLGQGTLASSRDPVLVLDLADVVDVEARLRRTCARTRDGRVACWGANEFGQADGDTRLGLLQPDGSWCGAGEPANAEPRNVRVAPSFVSGIDDAQDLLVSERYTCVLRAGGRVTCWGQVPTDTIPQRNILGRSNPDPAFVRADVSLPSDGESLVELRAPCIIRRDGEVACALTRALEPPPDTRFTHVFARGAFACGALTSGRTICWGGTGRCFSDDAVIATLAVPEHPVSISIGACVGCVVQADGSAACFPALDPSELVDDETVDPFRPVAVPLRDVVRIEVADLQACAIDSAHLVYCWGGDRSHESGRSDERELTTPRLVLLRRTR